MSDPSSENTVRESTRGVAVITLAKVWFLLTGFAQPLVLTRLLGADGYGIYGVVLNVVSILNNVVVAGSIQAMSHAVTAEGSRALRRGLLLHALLGAVMSLGLYGSAPALGVWVLRDARLPPLLRLGAIVVGNYSVYAALVGALNGRRRFQAQAGLDMTFATLRTGLVLGLAASALGVTGAVGGFALASTVILLTALFLLRGDLRGAEAPPEGALEVRADKGFGAFVRGYARFFLPVLAYQLALNLVLQADLLVMKALVPRWSGADDVAVNALAGVYKAVQNFAFLPYQLLLAVTFVAFPVVSKATLENDRETTEGFVRAASRFSAMALGAMLSVLAGVPRAVLRLAYRPPLDEGYQALRVLSLAQGAFALTVIGTTILVAAGRTALATGLMGAMLLCVFVGDVAGLSAAHEGIQAVNATAAGTAAGCFAGLALVTVAVRRAYGGFLPGGTALRVAVATAITAGAGSLLPPVGKVTTLFVAGALVAVYVVLLGALGELRREELDRIAKVVRRKR